MKIAHITDLHLRCHLPGTATIAARLSREMPNRFAAALAQIEEQAPDLLVITGDLLDFPLDEMEEPERLAQGLDDLWMIAEMVARMRCPLAVVPGNHDHPDLVAQVFGHLPLDFECMGYRVVVFLDEEQEGHVPLREGKDFERFHDVLLETESALNGLPQIHVQHYVVWPILNDDYPYNYGDAEAMTDVIMGSGIVRLVLSGHYHKGVPLVQVGTTYFAVGRAFCEAPHPFAVYNLDGTHVTMEEYQVRA